MSWSPWLYSLPPVGPDRTPPLHGPGGEGSAEAWAMPRVGLVTLPVPGPRGLCLGQAGAIFGIRLGLWGWFQMFQCEQEKMGTDGWRVPVSGSCWEQVIFRALLTLLGLMEPP